MVISREVRDAFDVRVQPNHIDTLNALAVAASPESPRYPETPLFSVARSSSVAVELK